MRDLVTRVGAIVRKEALAVIRQPRLLATLILGPFVILALVGFGYQTNIGPLATLVVTDPDSRLGEEVATRIKETGSNIDFRGIEEDADRALDDLRRGRVDIVVTIPPNPVEIVRSGESAVVEVFHNQLDPFEQATVTLLSRTTIDTVNRRILEELVTRGQQESDGYDEILANAGESAGLLRQSIESGDEVATARHRATLARQLQQLKNPTSPTGGLAALEELSGSQQSQISRDIDGLLATLESESIKDDAEAARSIENDLEQLNATIADFQSIPPAVLVSPFDSHAEVIDAIDLEITDFYAPGAMALLLQHLAITFAALSFVRERALGTPELFQVAPIRPVEILVGKYLGFLLISGIVATALTALMFLGFRIPLAGSLLDYVLVLLLLTLVALGIGFVISAAVASDVQAVNVAMIILLLSLFFSGFFISVDRLLPSVQAVSWTLPITHALDSLRDIMFRGSGVDLRTWVALGTGVIATFLISWRLTVRRLAAH